MKNKGINIPNRILTIFPKKSNQLPKVIILIALLCIFGIVLYLDFLRPTPIKKEVPEVISTTGERIRAQLYFSSLDGMFLVPEERDIPKADAINNQIKIVLLELINGPKDLNLVSIIPTGTNINEVYIDQQNIVYVDFSKEIKGEQSGGSTAELLRVYSIVNTITTNFPEIKEVQILVDGDTVDSLAGHIDVSEPIKPDTSFVQVLQKW